jgi:hypothetical protein
MWPVTRSFRAVCLRITGTAESHVRGRVCGARLARRIRVESFRHKGSRTPALFAAYAQEVVSWMDFAAVRPDLAESASSTAATVAGVAEEVGQAYPAADQDLLREYRSSLLRWPQHGGGTRNDQLPNRSQLGMEWLDQIRAAHGH